MKKMILIGRSECGKTTLKQVLSGRERTYEKTQAVDYTDRIIDTPGEYIQTKTLGGAIAIYSYEVDVIAIVVSATEPFTLFAPNIVSMASRDVIGIITQIDKENANVPQVSQWLKMAGCKKVFEVSSVTGKGISKLTDYLNNE